MLLTIERRLNRFLDWLGALSACLLIALVVIMAYNVVARYVFSQSSLGLEELSWHLYAAIFLLGIPFALRTDSHVRVDLIYERLAPRTQALIDLVGSVVFLLPFCIAVIWSGWHFVMVSYGYGEQPSSIGGFFTQLITTGIGEKSQDPGGLLNRWIIKGVIPLSFLFLLLAGVSFFLRRLNVFLASPKSAN